MPILDNAKKALRSSRRKEKVNQVLKSKTRTLVKRAKLEPTQDNISSAFSSIDKSVKKNLMHKNKAARIKSSLSSIKDDDAQKTPAKKKKAVKSDSKPSKKKSNKKSKKSSSK